MHRLLIADRRPAGASVMAITEPARGVPFDEVAAAGPADLDAAVAAARAAFTDWARLTAVARADILFRFADLVRAQAEELAILEARNVGKPIVDARWEAGHVADTLRYYAGAADKFCGQTIAVKKGGLDVTVHDPLGVVALIVPWNFPMVIATWKLAPALACGNTVVLKPASLTPLTALRLGELGLEAGLPPGVLNIVPGPGASIGAALAAHPDVAKIGFTGETATGRAIMAAAAATIKRVGLELGGKSPNIIFADVDIELVAREAVASVFANAGQDCCARSRVIVERRIAAQFVDAMVATAQALSIGDPLDGATQMGPLVSAHQRERTEAYIAAGQADGARLMCGGERLAREGYFLRPAVFAEARPRMRIVDEEIFGPVAVILTFESEDEAIALANDTIYGLSGSLWTNDLKRGLRVARAVRTGVLSVNSSSSVHLQAPFGGYKQSGLGRELGMQAMEHYSEVKNIYFETE
ncbi:MAG TPA: aldehyde dehydrogenase family protein [Candidatus Margulisiibacteriota bacterium]|nr:aldehyde dehydrogenase family protein [Candidatus Margulisiibacteriota bacterium]